MESMSCVDEYRVLRARVKEIKAGSETLLLIKDQDKFCAVGNKCNHAGVPLIGGV